MPASSMGRSSWAIQAAARRSPIVWLGCTQTHSPPDPSQSGHWRSDARSSSAAAGTWRGRWSASCCSANRASTRFHRNPRPRFGSRCQSPGWVGLSPMGVANGETRRIRSLQARTVAARLIGAVAGLEEGVGEGADGELGWIREEGAWGEVPNLELGQDIPLQVTVGANCASPPPSAPAQQTCIAHRHLVYTPGLALLPTGLPSIRCWGV